MFFKKKEEKERPKENTEGEKTDGNAQTANPPAEIPARKQIAVPPKNADIKKPSIFESIKNLRGALWRLQPEISGIPEDSFVLSEPKHLIILQKTVDPSQIDVRYPLLEPYAYTRIFWDSKRRELVYNIIEPIYGKDDREIFSKVMKGLMEMVDVELSSIKDSGAAINYMEKYIRKIVSEYGLTLTRGQFARLLYYVYRDFVGLNEIEPLMHDSYIEDIGCDGTGVPLYVVHRKFGSIRTNIIFKEMTGLNNFVVKLSERCGRYISYAEPLLDGTLPDGSRVQ
ncbi:MAG: hypothetical protein WA139_03305, partial [Candidatus Aenigmatarchaeota archaeon]